ncbi:MULTISPECIES: hypothetical protein [Serratia]|uniref:hypothetical protein n=1 Tax=Serratia TaxID=613 RepID=UPI000A77CB0F|nr:MULTISPECIES: hypothetical protein [Serratia]
METAFEYESQTSSRSYDGMPEFSATHKHIMAQILTTAATLERGYLAYQGHALTVFDEHIIQLDQPFTVWQACVEDFRKGLKADEHITPLQRDYVHAGLTQLTDRLRDLQTKIHRHKK